MNPVTLRSVSIGTGIPKICLPIVGTSEMEILQQASAFAFYPHDIVEWRVDWFEAVTDLDHVKRCAQELRRLLGETPLLFTFRTKDEGGERSISDTDYIQLNSFVAQHQLADALDVELFRGDDVVRTIVSQAHENNTAVVISNHNFTQTPPEDEIVSRLQRAEQIGGDILKIAVMPQTARDVITLLAATEQAHHLCRQPLITMSMGQLGMVSRVAGETFGSAVTFGAAGMASAPGQMPAAALQRVLQAMHGTSQD